MFEIQSYYSFITAVFLFQLFPGVGTIAILSATATDGPKAGMCAVLGTLAGDFIYMSAAVLGLAAILTSYPRCFAITQYLGVIYLCYLGLKYVFLTGSNSPINISSKKSNWKHFKRAFAVCLTNPKAIMFFLAFFPLFLAYDAKSSTLYVMMVHVTLISLVYQTLLVMVGNALAKYLSKWKYIKIVTSRLAGIALIGFSLKLAKNIK